MGNARFTLAATTVVLAGCSLLLDTSAANDPAAGPFVPAPSFEGGSGPETDAGGADDDDATAPSDAAADTAIDAGITCGDTVNDDFDTAALGARWDSLVPGPASFSLDQNDSVSKPASLLITWPAGPDLQGALSKNAPGSKAICCEMKVRFPTVHVRFLEIRGEGGNYLHYLATTELNIGMGEVRYGTPAINRGEGNWQTDGSWRRIRYEAKLPPGAGKGTLTMHVDDVLAIDTTIGDPAVDLKIDTIRVGAPYAQAQSAGTFRLDDVRCSAR